MSNEPPLITVNGVQDAKISPLDRGIFYGDGLFETCRFVSGKILLWSLHENRLLSGCARLGIPLDLNLLESYRSDLMDAAARNGVIHGVLKIIVTRGEGGRGYAKPESATPCYCLIIFPGLPEFPAQHLTLMICKHRLSSNSALAGIKHLNRLDQVIARSEWQDAFDEGLVMSAEGHVIEATAHNLFIVSAGCLMTPDLSNCGVAGVMRQFIVDVLAPQLSISVQIQLITLDDLLSAQEIFLCNSIRGILSVEKIVNNENSVEFSVGAVTSSLQEALLLFQQSQA